VTVEGEKRLKKRERERERERESIIYYSAPGQVPLSAIKGNTSRKLYTDILVQ